MKTTDDLYLIADPTGPVKIGRGSAVDRLSGCQTGNPRKLSLLKVWPNLGHIEKGLHCHFDHLRLEGEWFDFADSDPVEAVDALIADAPALLDSKARRRARNRERMRRNRQNGAAERQQEMQQRRVARETAARLRAEEAARLKAERAERKEKTAALRAVQEWNGQEWVDVAA